ncbi:unnamed protein product [Prorocentrum cordatum]|uniref:Uncharacterized protein n=1 Tax=Prorocentrum cordatum TaxID=2364126 RepID=A0ABN9R1S2_9DINO|nr:unnamed protein product [Polarella glacialis]
MLGDHGAEQAANGGAGWLDLQEALLAATEHQARLQQAHDRQEKELLALRAAVHGHALGSTGGLPGHPLLADAGADPVLDPGGARAVARKSAAGSRHARSPGVADREPGGRACPGTD